MGKLIQLFLIFLLLFQFLLPAKDNSSAGEKKWEVEISGGFLYLNNNDLRLTTEAENHYLDLYFRTPPHIETISDPGLTSFNHMPGAGIRVRYRLGRRFTIAAGLEYLNSGNDNSGLFSFRNHQGWRVLTDSLEYLALDTRLRLIFPNLGVSYRFPVSSKFYLETGLSAGPLFADARIQRHIRDKIEVIEVDSSFQYVMYQDEREFSMDGRGTGFGAAFNIRLGFRLNRRLGIFLESGCRFLHLNSLEGSGSLVAGGRTREWEGEWFMVEEHVEKEWGSADFTFPSNDPDLLNRGSGAFRPRIFGFPLLRIGLQIKL